MGGMGLRRCERSGGPASHTASALGGALPVSCRVPIVGYPGATQQAGSSVVERGLYTARVAGSIPVPPT
jgi:hypothetical protein